MIVSNSRIEAFNECEMKYAYLYNLRIEPKEMDATPWRGVIGHIGLAEYYANNRSRKAAFAKLDQLALEEIAERRFDRSQIIGEIKILLEQYFDFAESVDTFEVVAVETELTIPVGFGDDEFLVILDLIIRTKDDKYWVLDHKFVFNFYTEEYLKVNSQMPKYIKVARDKGYPVEGAIINMLRVREIKEPTPDKLFKRLQFTPSDTRIENVWKNQFTSLLRIAMMAQPKMALTNAVCKFCKFKQLCDLQLDGKDISSAIALDYVPRTSPSDEEERVDHGF